MFCQVFLIAFALLCGLCVAGLRHMVRLSGEQVANGRSRHRVTGVWTFLVVATVLTVAWNWTCFSNRTAKVSTSPDGSRQLTVERRHAFPRSELVDPAIIVGFRIVDAKTGATKAYARKLLKEESDYREPIVEWTQDGARVTGFDTRDWSAWTSVR